MLEVNVGVACPAEQLCLFLFWVVAEAVLRDPARHPSNLGGEEQPTGWSQHPKDLPESAVWALPKVDRVDRERAVEALCLERHRLNGSLLDPDPPAVKLVAEPLSGDAYASFRWVDPADERDAGNELLQPDAAPEANFEHPMFRARIEKFDGLAVDARVGEVHDPGAELRRPPELLHEKAAESRPVSHLKRG